jgi:hypothetical protein
MAKKKTNTLEGRSCAVSDLTQVARNNLFSLQFVEARLQEPHDKIEVSQTVHVAYARAMKAELDQTSSTLSLITPSP